MFTGLIEQMGSCRFMKPRNNGAVLSIKNGKSWSEPLVHGESIAVNGVCLTVTNIDSDGFEVDVLNETLRCSSLGSLRNGEQINLERALRISDRFGGHFVSGHIDEVGQILAIVKTGDDFTVRVKCSVEFAKRTVLKGSVSLIGISLTVSGIGENWFEVSIIPTTWQQTILRNLSEGSRVNLESDLLGKYVMRSIGKVDGLTLEALKNAGF